MSHSFQLSSKIFTIYDCTISKNLLLTDTQKLPIWGAVEKS